MVVGAACRARARAIQASLAQHIAVGYYGSRQMRDARRWLRQARDYDLRQCASWPWLSTYVKSYVRKGRVG